ncbi:MAG TPA: FG-GAP-like repeat-containing protein [Candidatus Polarisedimenticolia bacterium]
MPRSRFLWILAFLAVSPISRRAAAADGAAEAAAGRIRRLEYEVTFQPSSVIPGHPGGLQAANRAQDLRAYFLPEGVDLVRRTERLPSWTLHLSLREAGAAGRTEAARWAPPQHEGQTVTYQRGPILERYDNTEEGLLLTLELPAPDGGAAGEATFDLRTRLERFVAFDGTEVSFYQKGGRQTRIRILSATDDQGRDIRARLAARSRRLTIRYEPAGDVSGVIIKLALTGQGAALTGQGISTTPDWIAEINQAGASFGWSASTAGDVNGDGYSDLIISARDYDNGQSNEGMAFLYLGSASGLASSPAWSAEGNQADALFGFSVSTAGDVNADGYDDVIVGARDYDNGQSDEGRAWLYMGSASGLSTTPAWSAESDQANAQLGTSVATAGDVNGDGYADVVIGAQRYTNTQLQEGRAWLWLGGPSGLATSPVWFGENHQRDSEFGQSVSTAGDVNGDGYSDLLIGSLQYDNGQTNEGRVYVYAGSPSGPSLNPVWTFESNQTIAYLGFSLGAAGDVNGDGYSDIIVGSDLYDNGQSDEGRAYAFYGSAGGLSTTPNWTVESDQNSAGMGKQVFTAGDVNGDGFSDVIVGARAYTNGQSQEGRAHLYLGSPLGLSTTPVWVTESDQASARYAGSAATAGDVNGDGYSDVIVTASLYDNGQTDEGRAYLFLGSATGLVNAPAFSRESDQDGAGLGVAAAPAGDVNGDGFSDLIVGADRYDNGETDEGAAFLFLGSASGPATSPSWSAEGNQAGASFGASVAAAGDVNGDGYGDVAVGAPGFSNALAGEGTVYVYHGSAAGLALSPAWSAEGGQEGAELGISVAAAGDVNRDGFGDLVVGAPGFDNGQFDEGRAIVHLGSASGLSEGIAWQAEGDQDGARLGQSVAEAGDVDRDGFSDILIGAPEYDNGEEDEGLVALYPGSPFGPALSASWVAEGNQAGARFGASLATAGDVNGDGYSDLVVGAPFFDNGENDEGGAFLYQGGPAGPDAGPSWTTEGNQANARMGWSVASAGDLNGDGFSDIAVGAPLFDGALTDEGRVTVYHGSAAGPSATSSWTGLGGQADGRFGSQTAPAGDVNGDGFGDLLIGAPGYDNVQVDEGRAVVHLGNGRDGLERAPRQERAADSSTIALLGRTDSESSFRLRAVGRSPLGRAKVRLEWEVRPLGTSFSGTDLHRGTVDDTGAPGGAGSAVILDEAAGGLPAGTNIHWRLRVLTDSPYFPRLPWVSLPGNSLTETDARTAGCFDADGDGYGLVGNAECLGGLTTDCDDTSMSVYPGAPQVCDGVNNDCSAPGWPSLAGTNEVDGDGDLRTTCEGDCDDVHASVFPGAAQVCDGLNNDCSAPGWPSLAGTNEADADADTFSVCGGDCSDSDPTAWGTPAEAGDLILEHDPMTATTMLTWSPPGAAGGTATLYDVIRSLDPAGFLNGGTCSESDDGTDTLFLETAEPSPGAIFFYLVRAQNACPGPAGIGPLGFDSAGSPIAGRACP